MRKGISCFQVAFLIIIFLGTLASPLPAAPAKVKAIVDNASLKVAPEIGANTLASVPVNTVMEVIEKQGEWYKVTLEKEGVRLEGYIHEMLIQVITEAEEAAEQAALLGEAERSQAEIIVGIQQKTEESRNTIRQQKGYEEAIKVLNSLIARVFRVTDNKIQKQLAAEIYLWIGLAWAGLGDDYAVLNEFQKMFEVDQAYAKEATRNIVDPRVIALVQQAEKVYMGMIVEYSLEITTEPKEAKIVIDGKEAGTTPEIIRSLSPKLLLEVMKDGFKPVKEEIFLTQAVTKKEYKLESAGRSFKISSYPVGAQIFLDGQDTGKETNAELPQVPFGAHAVKLVKESYVDWLSTVDIVEDPKPFFLDVVLIGKNYVFNKKWGDPAGKVFLKPAGIAIDGDNNFYVIDESNANYKKVGPEGTVFWSGQELRDVKMLGGIAIDAEGNIYLTDQKKHFVLKLDKNGAAVQKWGKEGSGAEDLKIPLGIAVDKNNDIYVVDSGNGRIKKYAATGRLLKTWGRQSEAASDFVLPRAVAVNQRNEVFVLDKMGIKKFTAEGEYLATIGGVGSSDGLFNNASGLCIDQSNSIYVADSGNNRVQKFDDQGNFLGKWGSLGPADGQFSFPSGLAVDSRGNVYVTDRDNNRVQMFAVGSGPGR